MPNKKNDDVQLNEFKRVARQLGADESDNALDRAMGRLNLKVKPKPEGEAEHRTKDRADG